MRRSRNTQFRRIPFLSIAPPGLPQPLNPIVVIFRPISVR
jgi:hypothetical protein